MNTGNDHLDIYTFVNIAFVEERHLISSDRIPTLLVLTDVLLAMTLALPLRGSGPLVPCISILDVKTPKLSVAS